MAFDLNNEELEATKRIGKASNKNYISKDKIRAKIEELKKINVNGEVYIDVVFAIKTLEKLLEERENDV